MYAKPLLNCAAWDVIHSTIADIHFVDMNENKKQN